MGGNNPQTNIILQILHHVTYTGKTFIFCNTQVGFSNTNNRPKEKLVHKVKCRIHKLGRNRRKSSIKAWAVIIYFWLHKFPKDKF